MQPKFSARKTYSGSSNASGAIALNHHCFIVGDDEHNRLLIYDKEITRYPIQSIALSTLFPGYVSDAEDHELDLEGGTQLGDLLFWIGSHSTDRKGRHRPARHTLLAIQLTPDGNGQFTARAAGLPYTQLLNDLSTDPRFDAFALQHASTVAPKAAGGLSIEGLAATPENTLLIGLRNPLHNGQLKHDEYRHGAALVLELLNPLAVLHGAKAQFAEPISLDLGGFGIRDITWYRGQRYLLIAGPYHSKITNRLYLWSRKSAKVKHLHTLKNTALNLEAAMFYPGSPHCVQLLSDDGRLGENAGFNSVEMLL